MIIGLDEVGRGCWAGPLVAAAMALPEDFVLLPDSGWRLDDSKKLSRLQRQAADKELRGLDVPFAIGWVDANELDDVGMSKAVALAMRRAYDVLPDAVKTGADIIIDGSINYLSDVTGSRAVIKADGSMPAVSGASIIAKVARDRWMAEAAGRFPGYGFESHVGYGTAAHIKALREYGVCELHRRSFKPIRTFV